MAEDLDIDDQWLYGENPEGIPPETSEDSEKPPGAEEEPPNEPEPIRPAPVNHPEEFQDDGPPGVDDLPLPEKENGEVENEIEQEDGELKQNGDDEDDLDDESDDDINVVIGDIKATATYPQQHSIKRGGLTTTLADKSKQIQQPISKFQVEEFEQIGTINGMPSTDYSLDGLEDKPWRKPGADISDYFNYGFNEDTWKAYCERQKRIRINDSGVGVAALNAIGLPRGPMMMNDGIGNKYPPQNYMQPPPRPMVAPVMKMDAPKINTIQVMTADRREYSRKPGFPDLSVPPPMGYPEPYIPPPEYGFNAEPEPYYGGYEPTQDSQWMEHHGNPTWQPTEIKTLTGSSPPRSMGPPSRRSPLRRSASRERERDRDRERSKSVRPRDDREKSRRRERSRSRSRRHKSRSRSPTHRSHKKKKSSRRHEESD